MGNNIKTKSVVAFIDILGFKEIIENNEKDKHFTPLIKLRKVLNEAVNATKKIFELVLTSIDSKFDENLTTKLKVKQFSDNLYLSFDYTDYEGDFLLALNYVIFLSRYYQREMLINNYYVRGGIPEGYNYSDDLMIFSSALINAYNLESKVSIYPRIVIDEKIVKRINKS